MSDRNLYGDPQRAIAGATHGLEGRTRTYSAGEKIFPGDPLFGMVGDDAHCYRSHINAVTLTAAGDLIANNTIAVTINGIAIAPVLFADSTAETLSRLISNISLNPDIVALNITAFAVDGANAITIVGPGIDITASAAVTGGASQITYTATADTNMKFIGVAQHTELVSRKGTGFYDMHDSVNVRDFGDIYVPVAEGVNPGDKESAYIDLANGVFTNVATDNYDCGCYFRSNAQDGLARIEVRGLK